MDKIRYCKNEMKSDLLNEATELFSKKNTKKIEAFHKSMGELYNVTPLERLKGLANHLGIKELLVKDESKRGNLKAFKLLGGAYSVASSICKKLDLDISEIDFDYLKSDEVKKKLGNLVFAAASDGNHGKSVAWAANEFNQESIVYMPKGTVKDRVTAIEELGGTVLVTDMNYDGCVSEVNRLGKEKGWEVILDTAAEGDPEVATWVMQGYATMAYEAFNQLYELNLKPTHIFLQAGVGSMAASAMGVFINHTYPDCPKFYTLEPHQANCYYQSGMANDYKPRSVEGDMDSISAGLSCGVPNPISWEVIRNFADGFISCDDTLAANGMRILGNPLPSDNRITSGESGSIGTGFIDSVMKDKLKNELNLDENSVVLLFSTEGDTDSVNYRDIVWYGKFNSLK
ncbi:diaminopropionate ammonia-lyase [Mycoplasmatota bacterium]|nr:diaminopropionate ammonia-lyase [Mycoplasmatota bacterium]